MILRTKIGKNASRAWSAGTSISSPALSKKTNNLMQFRLSRMGSCFWSYSAIYSTNENSIPIISSSR